MYDVNKYKCYGYTEKREDGSEVPVCVAISTYAGKTVKGFAKMNPNDEFNWEAGIGLAAARCNAKIAAKRAKRADTKVREAQAQVTAAINHLNKMLAYQADAYAESTEASTHMKNLLEQM